MKILLSEYDRRQLERMEQKIALYEKNRIDLRDLVFNLSGLLDSLQSTDASWVDSFRIELNQLESVYNCINDGSISRWTSDPKKIIYEANEVLKKIVRSTLDIYRKTPDSSVLKTAAILDEKWLFCPDCTDAWESTSQDPMVICPKCDKAFHNPRCQK